MGIRIKLVKFYFESNVISAGIKTNNNFIRTEDVINGAVVRAAFANDILLDCEYAEENQFVLCRCLLKPWRNHRDYEVKAYQRVHEPEMPGH